MKRKVMQLITLTLGTFISMGVYADEGGITPELIIEQIGKFHPLLLHFPLTIISLLPMIYILTYFKFGKIWLPTIPYFIHFASLASLPTCLAGIMLAGPGQEISETLALHRNLTLLSSGAIILASLYLLFKKNQINEKIPMPLWALTALSFVLLVFGAHMGAESVHGEFLILFQ